MLGQEVNLKESGMALRLGFSAWLLAFRKLLSSTVLS